MIVPHDKIGVGINDGDFVSSRRRSRCYVLLLVGFFRVEQIQSAGVMCWVCFASRLPKRIVILHVFSTFLLSVRILVSR